MSCYYPLKAWPVGLTESGKTKYKITEYGVDHIDIINDCPWPSRVADRPSLASKVVRDYIEVPCGRCIGCRLAYSRAWADRCLLELKEHESSFFITLTYDDFNVPRSYYSDPDTGEAMQAFSLRKRDLQLFHKRLRKAIDYPIRFFACGEYGESTLRPHYHDIVFGLRLHDLKFYSRSELGYNYYNSDFLSKIWNKGHVVVGEVTWDTCAYTARYIMKKLKGDAASFYEFHNIEPPFIVMSRKPGIARKYYDEHPELFNHHCVYLSTEDGSHPVYPSRYYKKLFEVDFPEKSAILKEKNREIAMVKARNKLERTDLAYEEYLKVEEMNLTAKMKSLKRGAV